MTEKKRLTLSRNRKILGVCGGIAEYYSVDPTHVRVGAVVLLVLGVGSLLLVYLILAIVLPNG